MNIQEIARLALAAAEQASADLASSLQVGTIDVGPLDGSAGALGVTGILTSATAAISGAGTRVVAVVYPDLGSVPTISVTVLAQGVPAQDSQIEPPVISAITATGFQLDLAQTAAVVQDIGIALVFVN